MTSCSNCQAVVFTLKKEIQELLSGEQELKQSNDGLMQLLNATNERKEEEQAYWKKKYLERLKMNQILQERIQIHKKSKAYYSNRKKESLIRQDVSPFVIVRCSSKQNLRGKSKSRMSELMKALVIEKTAKRQYSSIGSANQEGKRKNILRIIDDRLNHQF